MTDHVVHRLEPDESDPGHACTSVALYAPDMDLLAYLLQDLRTLLRAEDAGRAEVVAHHPKLWTVHGLRRRTVVCDPVAIRRPTDVCVVGFFAERRDSIDYEHLDDLELDLLFEFRQPFDQRPFADPLHRRVKGGEHPKPFGGEVFLAIVLLQLRADQVEKRRVWAVGPRHASADIQRHVFGRFGVFPADQILRDHHVQHDRTAGLGALR